MDLRLIETFVQAARRESFSAAAKTLGVSPGAVSQNIKALEDQLQVRLFQRTTRQVKLTPEGARYLQRCAPALEALNGAAEDLAKERTALRGRLRVTSTTAFGRMHIVPAIVAFQAQHPELTIELSLTDQFVDLVAEEFDLAIRAGVLPDSDYVSRLLVPITPLTCAAPRYLREHGEPATLKDLKTHRLVGMRANPSQKLFAWEFAGPTRKRNDVVSIDITPHLILNDPAAVGEALVQGAGIGQLGSNVTLPLIRAGRLQVLFRERAVQSRGIHAVYPSRRYAPLKLTAFLAHLVETFANRVDLVWEG